LEIEHEMKLKNVQQKLEEEEFIVHTQKSVEPIESPDPKSHKVQHSQPLLEEDLEIKSENDRSCGCVVFGCLWW